MNNIIEIVKATIKHNNDLVIQTVLSHSNFLFNENIPVLERHQISQLLNISLSIDNWDDFKEKISRYINHQAQKDEKRERNTWASIKEDFLELLQEPEKKAENRLKTYFQEHQEDFDPTKRVLLSQFNWQYVGDINKIKLLLAKRYLIVIKQFFDIKADKDMVELSTKLDQIIGNEEIEHG
jgi:hypothetical protein